MSAPWVVLLSTLLRCNFVTRLIAQQTAAVYYILNAKMIFFFFFLVLVLYSRELDLISDFVYEVRISNQF